MPFRFAAVTGFLLATWTVPSTAQAPALPVSSSPSHNKGLVVQAVGALGDGDLGTDKALALTLGYARDRVRVTAILGRAGSREDRFRGTTVFGANASWRLARSTSPALSFDVQAGAGAASFDLPADVTLAHLNVPLGVGAAFLAPTPAGNIELWAAPRVQLRRSRLTLAGEDETDTHVGGGLATGIEWTSVHGLGVHFAADWLRIGSSGGEGHSEWSLALGALYRWIPRRWSD
jgi:hypothetical protein